MGNKNCINLEFRGTAYEWEGVCFDYSTGSLAGLFCDEISDLSILIDGKEIDDKDILEKLDAQMHQLPMISFDFYEEVVGIRRFEGGGSCTCMLEIEGDFNPAKLIINVAPVEFVMGSKKWDNNCMNVILDSVTYDNELYKVSLNENELSYSEFVWGCDPDDDDSCEYDWDDESDEEEDILEQLEEDYDKVFLEDSGIYTVRLDGKWGFVSADGEELISPQYKALSDAFVDGAIITWGENGLVGFVNDEGEEIVSPKYGPVMDFQNSMAAVSLEGKWGFIDKSGTEVIPLIYDNVEPFDEDKAKVILNGETFYIDKSGNRIINKNNKTMKAKAIYQDYEIVINENNSVTVSKSGSLCSNAKGTMRTIASEVGFTIEDKWTTQQLGKKLVAYLNSNTKEEVTGHVEGTPVSYTVDQQFAALAYRIVSDDGKVWNEEIQTVLELAEANDCLDAEKVKEYFTTEKIFNELGMPSPLGDINEIMLSVKDEDKKFLFTALCFVTLSDWEFTPGKKEMLMVLERAWGIGQEANDIITDAWEKLESAYPERGEIQTFEK